MRTILTAFFADPTHRPPTACTAGFGVIFVRILNLCAARMQNLIPVQKVAQKIRSGVDLRQRSGACQGLLPDVAG